MSDKLDDLLKNALTPSEEPGAWLNQRIIRKAKGDNIMKKPFFKTVPVAAALAIGILAAGSLTTYAAWRYLSAEQVAENVGDKKLAKAFQDKDAININESQSYGDYKYTLLGIVSGENLSHYTVKQNGEIQDSRTYAVISIEKKDGSAMPDIDDKFYKEKDVMITPFIKGEAPEELNVTKMGIGSTAFVQEGVEYRIVDCDNLEAFAKRGVYLGVVDNIYEGEPYLFDKETGEITPNKEYDGVNVLFQLPLDESKGDETLAKEQIEKWKNTNWEKEEFSVEVDDAEGDMGNVVHSYTFGDITVSQWDETDKVLEEEKKWDAKRVQEEAVLIKESVQTVKPDEEGIIHFDWEWNGHSGSGSITVDDIFKKNQYGMSDHIKLATGEKKDSWLFTTFSRNEDGTVTVALYRTKNY